MTVYLYSLSTTFVADDSWVAFKDHYGILAYNILHLVFIKSRIYVII